MSKFVAKAGYNPLQYCPSPGKYEKLAERARNGSPPAMIRLKCLECCCWNSAEVKRCSVKGCALWARAHREEE